MVAWEKRLRVQGFREVRWALENKCFFFVDTNLPGKVPLPLQRTPPKAQ